MNYFKTAWLAISVTLKATSAFCTHQDSTYVVSYTTLLTGRVFLSQKFTSFRFKNTKEHYALDYRPNTNMNVGLGATYKWASVNLSYGFGFLNPDKEKGKTKYLDLQLHAYGQKSTLDVLGQFYRGFYLFPKGTSASLDRYYIRPDMRVNIIGGSYQYILNYKRFSLRAPYLQNEWQKKSAGSILVGFAAYTGRIKADSTLTPVTIHPRAASMNETRTSFLEFGPNIGYAYTLVVRENFFLTGSASLGVDYGINTLTNIEGKNYGGGVSTNIFARLIAGYNSERWAVSAIYLNNSVRLASIAEDRELVLNTGNFRVSFVHRFVPGSREKKLLKVIK